MIGVVFVDPPVVATCIECNAPTTGRATIVGLEWRWCADHAICWRVQSTATADDRIGFLECRDVLQALAGCRLEDVTSTVETVTLRRWDRL